jgi:choline dehydrogenase-like flavoprotein/threonine dehydrogenase-like Zn-dependent dehydrogenase
VLDYDVCVVGSGAAGATAALGLVGRGLRIAVLEGGGVVPDEVSTSFTELECTAHPILRTSRERWLGGATNAWTGGKTTLDDVDLRSRPWVPHSGWPIDSDRLRTCYERAAALLDRPGPDTYDGPAAVPNDGLRFDGDDLRTIVFHQDAEPLRFGPLLLDRLRGDDGVHVITLANVVEVRLDEGGTRVDGVDAATITGRRFQVRARAVVLACGAIENARLLLASRSRRPAGLGNAYDVVGRYYQDHPKGYTGGIEANPSARRLPASAYWTGGESDGGWVRWGIGLTEAAQESRGVLNSFVRLEPVVLETVPAAIAALRAAARGRVKQIDPHALADLPRQVPSLVRLARFRVRNEGPIDMIRVRSFLEQEPRPDNRVRLSERRDPLGLPLAAVDWKISEDDRRSVRVLHDVLATAVRRLGIGELRADLEDTSVVWDAMIGSSHHAGTTRMGTDPHTSVTGPDGQVHDVPGLFVAGASLFPTSGYANPVFSIAAVALHVADHVAEHLSAAPVAAAAGHAAKSAGHTRLGRPAVTTAGLAEAKRWVATRRRARKLAPPAARASAIVWLGPGQADVVPVEVSDPGHGQLSVLVDASAVSPGTERARWLGLPGAKVAYPHQPGYSLAGVVHAVGPGVHDIGEGTRVAVWGAPHQSLVTVGWRQVHPLVEGSDMAEASLVTLGAIAELGAARAGDVVGQSVAVIGAGAIGLLAQRIIAADGAAATMVVAASGAKDDLVLATPSARPCSPADVDDLHAEVVIEATGAPEGVELALRAAAPGAIVVLLGTTRSETVPFRLDVVQDRGLRVVGAHAGILDLPGGVDGLDRRGAAQRFLDRQADRTVSVGDLVTDRLNPVDAAALYDRLARDRKQVVPVLEWWRLAPDQRLREGPLALPNPLRRGLATPLRPTDRPAGAPDHVVDHPQAPPLTPAASRAATGARSSGLAGEDEVAVAAARLAAVAAAAAAPIRVQGAGALCDQVRKELAEHGAAFVDDCGEAAPGAPGAQAGVVIDLDPTGASVSAGLAALDPRGTLLVAGTVEPVEIDVQSDIHKRGATVVGVPPGNGETAGRRWEDG